MANSETNEKINTLLKKIEENDLFALADLMDLKTPAITAIACNILRDKFLAEDIVNEVMVALIQNVHKFKNYENINGWLNAVTINKSIDLLRKNANVSPIELELATTVSHEYGENDIIEKLDIVSALEMMTPDEQKVFTDKYVEDLTLSELSVKYAKSVKQIRTILKKAKEKFTSYYYPENIKKNS